MAAKLSLVKKLIRDDSVNVNYLILSALFGNNFPQLYDPNKVYNKGDSILFINDKGEYEILICMKDGATGPFYNDLWQQNSFTTIFKEESVINQVSGSFADKQEAIADDVATLVYNLAGLVDANKFNLIFRENFKNQDNISIINGEFDAGSIKSDSSDKLEFTLANPYEISLVDLVKFKLKHYITISGVVNLEGQMTFNALDSNPFWFNINEAILDGSFFEIPEFTKEENIPYALNIRIKGSGGSVSISDLMVVFI